MIELESMMYSPDETPPTEVRGPRTERVVAAMYLRRVALLGAILVASLASPVVGQGRDESGCLKLDGSNFNDEVQRAIDADSESLCPNGFSRLR